MNWRLGFVLTGLFLAPTVWAGLWNNLWFNKDQQAQQMMSDGHFAQAKDTYQRNDWIATAAYRSGDYEKAADFYERLKTKDGFYNAGNAYAHLGQFEKALAAYDKALNIDPKDKDSLYNRKLVEDLMKKDKDRTENKSADNQQNQNQNNESQQNKNQQGSGQNKQQKQNKNQQGDNQKDPQNSKQNKQDNQAENQKGSDKQNANEHGEDKKNAKANKKNQNKQTNASQSKQKSAEKTMDDAQAQSFDEEKQAKEQWLRLIPDDPGGLLREKFLRDHLRREHGWDQ